MQEAKRTDWIHFLERIRLLESGEALLRLRKEYERLPEEKTREIHQLKAKRVYH